MKRLINILLIICVAIMSGCMTSEIIEIVPTTSIDFNAYIDKSTRSAVVYNDIVGDLGNLEAFVSGTTTWDNRTSTPSQLMNTTLSIDSDRVITAEQIAAWPGNDNYVTFYGYYPTTDNLTSVAPTASSSFELEYTLDADPTKQPDVIFTEVQNRNLTNSVDGVTLHYSHILSKIDILAYMDFDFLDDAVVVTSVELAYGTAVKSQAAYTYDGDSWGWDFEGYSATIPANTSTKYNMLTAKDGVAVRDLDSRTSIIDNDKYIMMIPQTLTGLYITVSYENCYGEKFTRTAITPGYVLEAGKQYNYLLYISSDNILFDAIIEQEWDESVDVKVPIQVGSVAILSKIGKEDGYPLDGDYVVINDFDGEFYSDYVSIENFTGTFDGGGYTISNLKSPIFDSTENAKIENVNVKTQPFTNVDYTTYYGAIVGYANNSMIINCGVSGDDITLQNTTYVGGIVGQSAQSSIIGCYNHINISGTQSYSIGGIVGASYNNTNIIGCYNTGMLSDGSNVGGIIGYSYSNEITACYNAGRYGTDTFVEGDKLGGIIGYDAFYADVNDCYNQHGSMSHDAGTSFNSLSELPITTLNSAITSAGYDQYVQFAESGNGKLPKLRSEDNALFTQIIESDTHPIFSIDDLKATPDTSGSISIMMNNIEFTSTSSSWIPIGRIESSDDIYFYGTFEGNSKTITGLYIGANSTDSQGFTSRSSGTIRNLTLNSPKIAGSTNVGIITGANYGVIDNCHVISGTSSGTSNSIGGISGYNKGFVSNCTTTNTSVSGTYRTGGITGYHNVNTDEAPAYIKNCSVSGATIKATSTSGLAGGIAGDAWSGYIQDCIVSSTTVSSSGPYVGGIAGNSESSLTIARCANKGGSVSGTQYVGGVTGFLNISTIVGSYNTASVTGTSSFCGGIAGQMKGAAIGCYNTGAIKGDTQVGGVAGRIAKAGSIYSCYNTGALTMLNLNNATDLTVGDITGVSYSTEINTCYYVEVANDSATLQVGKNASGGTLKTATSTTAATLNSSTAINAMNTTIQNTVSGYSDVVYTSGATTPTFAW